MTTLNLSSKDTFTNFQLLSEGQTKLSFDDLNMYDPDLAGALLNLYVAIDPTSENTNMDHLATASFKNGVFNTLYTFRLLNINGKACLSAGGNTYELDKDLKAGTVEFELQSVASKTAEGKDTTIAQLETDIGDTTFIIPVALAQGVDGATVKRALKKGSSIVDFLGLPPARPMRMEDIYRSAVPGEFVDPQPSYLLRVTGVKQGIKSDYGYSYTIQVDPESLPTELYDRDGQKLEGIAALYAKSSSAKLLANAFEGSSDGLLKKINTAIAEQRCYLKITGCRKVAAGYTVDNGLQILPEAPKPVEPIAVPN